ncbi:hypothetical protein PPROV_000749200 [Pycnococcus provasolii]|uniref:tryptophan--tRNA ligase n=1 Tax=Pycnococcus provasolii TaxID=41880 RepID=A0A830HPZ2_9CHLO|nr:hypothetical protein PPROV_000749200 [Pycnococcus provasolii]|mmetsp:Transcript_11709/g.30972  ORF Transcript_11709/g.30972 Transcript_11709/m.30972 type:complete len:428 (-) Transcript_11709:77-1360(-)
MLSLKSSMRTTMTSMSCSPASMSMIRSRVRVPQRAGLTTTKNFSLKSRHVSLARASASPVSAEASAPPASATSEEAESKPERRKRMLSGVQPTGDLHLGNYFGAIRNWVTFQENFDAFFCVVDLHAITVQPHDPKLLRDSTLSSAAMYLASGIDPARSNVFVQSHVRAHSELTWLLNCVTPLGWLQRMIQFKEKAVKQGEDVGVGLLDYPVLMAADILLYQADLVPVGEDQRQHLELTRDIAGRVNDKYGGKKWKKRGGRGGRVFRVPEAYIPPAGARVMSMTDGKKKMSKSDPAEGSRINLLDPPDVIANKVKRCKTDAFDGLEYGNDERPEANNLLSIYELATGLERDAVLAEVGSCRWGEFKPRLAEAVVEHLRPIQERYHDVRSDDGELERILARGAEAAAEVANATVDDCRDALGFAPGKRL